MVNQGDSDKDKYTTKPKESFLKKTYLTNIAKSGIFSRFHHEKSFSSVFAPPLFSARMQQKIGYHRFCREAEVPS